MLSLGAPDRIDYKLSFPSVFKELVKEHAIPRKTFSSRAKRFPAAPGVSARPATLLHALYVLLLA